MAHNYQEYVKKSIKNWVGPKGYLGKFKKLKFLALGHNFSLAKCQECMDKCNSVSIIRKPKCIQACQTSSACS